MIAPGFVATVLLLAASSYARPAQVGFFDVQGHRGGRGEAIENSLPSFAWGLIDGVSTLELDNGLTKDGVVVVWHDEAITAEKCRDTSPVTPGDPLFPYVGKQIANLTLAQIKTLDCGSQRVAAYPLQLLYPGTKIATLGEVFAFAHCVDQKREIVWNIESKINPVQTNATRSVDDFVKAQHAAFVASGYPLSQITYQSFDWRTLIEMKKRDSRVPTATLIDLNNIVVDGTGLSPWLAGVNISSFPGPDEGSRIAEAAKSIKANVLSPYAGANLTALFTTKDMIQEAHQLGLTVAPWTVNRLDIAEQLMEWGVDGIITDYPFLVRRLAVQRGHSVASTFSQEKVMGCLDKHLQRV
ncbi:hypothetical protein EST38_g2947 [Candolleomyces aberdarensis]|uniref:GP-PDE domain-containing protein n=1 Tax=Candolleomyces aberdarensis TaxID=2316362 RepID=A0A4Q2DTE9_9AGAR|nr:hypothetical protein EST38_g2947 [Candolleomyces aberdarensis]